MRGYSTVPRIGADRVGAGGKTLVAILSLRGFGGLARIASRKETGSAEVNRRERRALAKKGAHRQGRLPLPDALSLAVQLHQAGRLDEADAVYQRILEAEPEQPDALHFRGVLHHQMGRSEEAIALIERAVALVPDHAGAHNNLGNVLMERGRRDEALAAYQRAVELDPDHADAQCNLGVVLKEKGQFEKAVAAYRKVLASHPDHADAHHNLGNALKKLGRFDEALAAYRRAIELRPHYAAAYSNLARALAGAGRIDEAAKVYRRWLDADPDDPVARHMLAACSGEAVPARASDDYVRTTFDRFANTFDEVLGNLDYRAPELVAAALAAEVPAPDGSLDVLDAGCGTGLCAPLLKPFARRLIGVDLSPAMIAKAREIGLYDELVTAELTAFLDRRAAAYDVIVSADTLVYFGALEAVLAAAAGALRPGGRLVFTTERAEEGEAQGGYRLHAHGRYSHTESYLGRSLAEAGFALTSTAVEVLRTETGQPVTGTVALARKKAG